MAGKDFAQIALDNKIRIFDELEQSMPLKFSKKYFKPSDTGCDKVTAKTDEELLSEYKRDLNELREKYKPFMKNLTPEPLITRKTREIKDFLFRYECNEDRFDLNYVFDGKGNWEEVTIPDYRGPVGRWNGYYRTVFTYDEKPVDKRVFIRFCGVDYIANVYLNGRYVGSHEGFFAAFEFDITDLLRYGGENVLVVEVKNDLPTIGDTDEMVNGDKIYAATGLGWDDPEIGWHHCPAGAGIWNRIVLEERAGIFVHSIFVRPDIDTAAIEVRVEVYSTFQHNMDIVPVLSVYPYNFEGEPILGSQADHKEPAGYGMNYYRFTMHMHGFRQWDCNNPWLYTARISLMDAGGSILDIRDSVFGMRKFHMDTGGTIHTFENGNKKDRGTLFLNNLPVILRGANDMGHMQRCVMKGDFDQLIDDILIAKLANINFFRFTQRPVQEEIYHYCDMLGMMNQTDLPLFGYLRRNQFCEALKQVAEMERHIRSHPSAIMVTYINERMPTNEHKLGHRHLYKDELEKFFEAADRVISVENPDRVVKHADGDYDPPTGEGLSDFHCYTLWYTNHGMPFGKLYKGYLPPTKKGWKTGCGEYGTEGLDNYALMKLYYPDHWLPVDEKEQWKPDRIAMSQTYSMHGDWYEEQETITEWIRESQKHQVFATSMMTDALRRRSDKVISSAIHLLIDAWPAGWMKALVGVDRIPKPAYYAYRKSLEPVRVNLRCDRWTAYEGDTMEVEAWLLNDTPYDYDNCAIYATLRDDEKDYASFRIICNSKKVQPSYAGTVRFVTPAVCDRRKLYLDAALYSSDGALVNCERFEFEVFEKRRKPSDEQGIAVSHNGCDFPEIKSKPVSTGYSTAFIGKIAGNVLEKLGINKREYIAGQDFEVLVVSNSSLYEINREAIMAAVDKGAIVLFLEPEDKKREYGVQGGVIKYRYIFEGKYCDGIDNSQTMGIYFAARDKNCEAVNGFKPSDFSFWYNSNTEMIDFIAVSFVEAKNLSKMVFTYKKPEFQGRVGGSKERLALAGEILQGKGKLICLSLCLEGRVGVNPVLDRFLIRLINANN